MISTSSTSVPISHITVDMQAPFDDFIRELERLAGRFDPAAAQQSADARLLQASITQMEGEQGLMIFGKLDHGALFRLTGDHKKLLRYYIGNPLIAFSMTQHAIGAALYAPLSMLVSEVAAKVTRVEFDLPSTLFGQFGHPAVTNVGLALDEKLNTLIEKAAGYAKG
jgi:uncharacterized protein (DUF302 family)